MSLFTELDQLKTELDKLRPLSPEQEARVLQKFRLEWNYNSNAIEGNSLTLGETRSLLLHGLTAAGKPMRDHLDIKGHNEAVFWLEDMVRDERPLTEQFIRGMHEVLLGEAYDVPAQTADGKPTRKHIVPGQYKQLPNNVLTATGEMFYFASPEETQAMMTDLVDWYRQEVDHPTLHPVALAAEFHYRFVRIHPFDDGNGRMSRLLMNLILMRGGYPMTVIKASDRNQYLASLATADAGESEPFYRFVSENVTASLQLMIRAAKGESIEEPDDLDKKVSLLKKEILNAERTINITWSTQTQSKFYEVALSFWLEDIANEMDRYKDLFFRNEISISYHRVNEKYFGGSQAKSLEAIKEDVEQYLSKPDIRIDHIIYAFEWTTFRYHKNTFNVRLLVDFKFSNFEFTVGFRLFDPSKPTDSEIDENILSTFIYRDKYSRTIMHDISHQIANSVYEFIIAKHKEA